MRAGRLDRRITISRRTETVSVSGSVSEGWTAVATVWASVKYERGAERFATQQSVGHGAATFTIRWSETVSEVSVLHRIAFDGRDYDVRDVRELGRREGIEIDAIARSEQPLTA